METSTRRAGASVDYHPIPIELIDVTDEQDLAAARERRRQFDRNSDWLQQHIAEVYAQHRGKFVCIAGAEAFFGDTVQGAVSLATAAHPDDQGWFTRYIPLVNMARVYASQR